MRAETDPEAIVALLDGLATAGFLARRPGTPGGWEVVEGHGQGHSHGDGKRYWGVDVSTMLPVYQELYERIFAARLEAWGAATEDVGVLRRDGLILYWGPEALMMAKAPGALARGRLARGDVAWGAQIEAWWQETAATFEGALDRWWTELRCGHARAGTLQEAVEGKVRLTAIGVDNLAPQEAQIKAWLAPHISPELLDEVASGCCLPATGCLAYDLLEWECWQLAAALRAGGALDEQARCRFVREGLFFLYDTLNTDRKAYYFHDYPAEVAERYANATPDARAIAVRLDEVRARAWHRRLHRLWASRHLATIADADTRGRLWAAYRLLGTARDYDEEKRRLNAKFWRALFALADGLGVSLSRAGLRELSAALGKSGERVVIDSTFLGD